jgi:hypothetical protein
MKKIILSTIVSTALLFGAYNSIGTDYDKAITKSFTEESTLEALNTVNMILAFMKDSRADKFINKGPYKALMKDDEKSGEAPKTGQSTTKVEELIPMTLNVTRDINTTNAPMVVNMWMDDSEGPNDSAMRIIGQMTVNKGVSTEYPLGDFTFHFGGFRLEANGDINTSAKIMSGVMDITKGANIGQAQVKYKNEFIEGPYTMPEELSLTINVNASDGNSDGDTTDDGEEKGNGVAYTKVMDWGEQGPTLKAYKLSLSNKYYKVQEVNATTDADIGAAVVKDKEIKIHKIFRYGLYHDDNGSKLTANSGFPIKDDLTKLKRGYIGYWGLWSEDNEITNGMDVIREGDSSSPTYTVVMAPGKLKKYTKATTLMSNIHGSKLFFYNDTNNQQYILMWDENAGGGNGNYKILGAQNNYGEATTIASSGDYVFNTGGDDNSTNPLVINEWNGAWSEALQANIPVDATYTNATLVSYHKEEVVAPNTDLNLINFGREIINPNMDVNDLNNTARITADQNSSVIGNQYLFDSTNLILKDVNRSNATVELANGADFNNTNIDYWQWGAQMGPLLDSSLAQATDGTYNNSNYWDVEKDENIYYRWETGPNNWNKFTGIKNTNTNVMVNFDPPVTFNYEHTQAKDINDATDNAGFYSMQYDGFSLQVPWVHDGSNGWQPKINLKNGVQLTNGSTNYRVKILDEGLLIGDATDYAGSPALEIPDGNLSVSGVDHNATLILNMGDKPADANVTVIKGECVKADCSF